MGKSKYQKFIVETIKRSQIKNAPYNPRIIDESAKEKLKKSLSEHGLVEPLIWNKKTGNLVGGHQRLEQLDQLEENKNYSLDVSVVAVDEREEATLNVILNNQSLMGDWDLEKLADLKLDFDIDFEDFGFDQYDVDFLFEGDDRFSELYETPEVEATKEEITKVRDSRRLAKDLMTERNSANYYCMLVFKDEDERSNFFRDISTPDHEDVITLDHILRYVKAMENI